MNTINYKEKFEMEIDNTLCNIIYDNPKPTSIKNIIINFHKVIKYQYYPNDAKGIFKYMDSLSNKELNKIFKNIQNRIKQNYK